MEKINTSNEKEDFCQNQTGYKNKIVAFLFHCFFISFFHCSKNPLAFFCRNPVKFDLQVSLISHFLTILLSRLPSISSLTCPMIAFVKLVREPERTCSRCCWLDCSTNRFMSLCISYSFFLFRGFLCKSPPFYIPYKKLFCRIKVKRFLLQP